MIINGPSHRRLIKPESRVNHWHGGQPGFRQWPQAPGRARPVTSPGRRAPGRAAAAGARATESRVTDPLTVARTA